MHTQTSFVIERLTAEIRYAAVPQAVYKQANLLHAARIQKPDKLRLLNMPAILNLATDVCVRVTLLFVWIVYAPRFFLPTSAHLFSSPWHFVAWNVVWLSLKIAVGSPSTNIFTGDMNANAVIDHDVPSNYNIVDANTISLLAKPL